MTNPTTFQLIAPHFTAGGVVSGDTKLVRTVDPMLSYMQDWPIEQVRAFAREKGWTFWTASDNNRPSHEPNHPHLL